MIATHPDSLRFWLGSKKNDTSTSPLRNPGCATHWSRCCTAAAQHPVWLRPPMRKTTKRKSPFFVCDVYHGPNHLRCKFEKGQMSEGGTRCKRNLDASGTRAMLLTSYLKFNPDVRRRNINSGSARGVARYMVTAGDLLTPYLAIGPQQQRTHSKAWSLESHLGTR